MSCTKKKEKKVFFSKKPSSLNENGASQSITYVVIAVLQ